MNYINKNSWILGIIIKMKYILFFPSSNSKNSLKRGQKRIKISCVLLSYKWICVFRLRYYVGWAYKNGWLFGSIKEVLSKRAHYYTFSCYFRFLRPVSIGPYRFLAYIYREEVLFFEFVQVCVVLGTTKNATGKKIL